MTRPRDLVGSDLAEDLFHEAEETVTAEVAGEGCRQGSGQSGDSGARAGDGYPPAAAAVVPPAPASCEWDENCSRKPKPGERYCWACLAEARGMDTMLGDEGAL